MGIFSGKNHLNEHILPDVIPGHVAIIMDGNGRWAKLRGKERSYGHKIGSNNVEKIVAHAFKSGVTALSLYAFSSENWSRPKAEVDELMRLLKVYFKKFIGKLLKNDIRLMVMGDLSVLDAELQKVINEAIEKSSTNTGTTLNIALNYGGRQEIVRAVNSLLQDGKEITVEGISSRLYTAPIGEPDLIIRTGGEFRVSNFLLWQSAYSEYYITDTLFPDLDGKEIGKAIESFYSRKRRFGGLNPEDKKEETEE